MTKMFRKSASKILKFWNVRTATACTNSTDTDLKAVLSGKIKTEQEKVKQFRSKYGKTKVGEVTVDMMYGGMRGIKALVYETSLLDLEKGILYRGLTIKQMQECLPKAPCGNEPLPEAIFWLLLTGDIPNEAQANYVSREWAKRSCLPDHVTAMLCDLPNTVHPMAKFSAAVVALSSESVFSKAYFQKVPKSKYWEYVYEDAMDLIAKIIVVAAQIYRNTYRGGSKAASIDPKKDWTYNLCKMMGFDDPEFFEVMRMYLSVHSDHEGGNVSAHSVHLCGSALSDPYLAFASGLNGLAGPLHGLANQESLEYLLKIQEKLGDKYTEEQLTEYVKNTLKSGQVVPGFGHAVLRITDPRYTAMRDFATKHFPDDPMFKIVSDLYKVVPPLLKATGKVANPWPNVDSHSGVLLQHYGLKEDTFYTVLFGIARAIGTMAALIWDRAHGFPIERPKSLTTEALMKAVGASQSKCK